MTEGWSVADIWISQCIEELGLFLVFKHIGMN